MKMTLTKKEQRDMDAVADYLYENYMAKAITAGELVNVKPITLLLSDLRDRLNARYDQKAKRAKKDNRERKWKYNFAIFDTTVEAIGSEVYRQSEVCKVRGLNAVIEALQDFITTAHERDDFDPETCGTTSLTFLKRRFGGMRPTISKNGGRATTSIPYVVSTKKFMVYVRLARAELELDKDLDTGSY